MTDWAATLIAAALFIVLSPGMLFQMPGKHRPKSCCARTHFSTLLKGLNLDVVLLYFLLLFNVSHHSKTCYHFVYEGLIIVTQIGAFVGSLHAFSLCPCQQLGKIAGEREWQLAREYVVDRKIEWPLVRSRPNASMAARDMWVRHRRKHGRERKDEWL